MDITAAELRTVGVILLFITIFISLLSVTTFGMKSREFGTGSFVWANLLLIGSISGMFATLVYDFAGLSHALWIFMTLAINSAFLGALYHFYRGIERNLKKPFYSKPLQLFHRLAQGSLVLVTLLGVAPLITATASLYYIAVSIAVLWILQRQPLRSSGVSAFHLRGFFGFIALLNSYRFFRDMNPLPGPASEGALWFVLIVICLTAISGVLIFAFFVFDSQITVVSELKNQLQHLAETDPLTGLKTRNGMQRHLETLSGHSSHSLLLIDLDNFKKINDQYGHQVGDQMLACLGRVVLKTIRESDLAVRYGGEEFLLVLSNVRHEGTLAVAERIRVGFAETARETFQHLGLSPTLTIGGITEAPSLQALQPLIEVADQNLYEGKRSGKNKLCITLLPASA